MNKKIMLLTITVLTLVMMTTPLIGAVQACRSKKRCLRDDFNFTFIGGTFRMATDEGYPKFCPQDVDITQIDGVFIDPNLEKVYVKLIWDAHDTAVMLNIGGKEYSTADNEIFYEATMWAVRLNPSDGENDCLKFLLKYTITFNPETTGIDGTFAVTGRGVNYMTNTPISGNNPPTSFIRINGRGTGDLKSVRLSGTGEHLFDPLQSPPVWIEHQGKIKCWPRIETLTGTYDVFPDNTPGVPFSSSYATSYEEDGKTIVIWKDLPIVWGGDVTGTGKYSGKWEFTDFGTPEQALKTVGVSTIRCGEFMDIGTGSLKMRGIGLDYTIVRGRGDLEGARGTTKLSMITGTSYVFTMILILKN